MRLSDLELSCVDFFASLELSSPRLSIISMSQGPTMLHVGLVPSSRHMFVFCIFGLCSRHRTSSLRTLGHRSPRYLLPPSPPERPRFLPLLFCDASVLLILLSLDVDGSWVENLVGTVVTQYRPLFGRIQVNFAPIPYQSQTSNHDDPSNRSDGLCFGLGFLSSDETHERTLPSCLCSDQHLLAPVLLILLNLLQKWHAHFFSILV